MMHDRQTQLPSVAETYELLTSRNPISTGRRHRESEEGAQGSEIFMRCVNAGAHRNGDAHPSLRINAKKDTWVCDPCGIGGRSIHLLKHAGSAHDNASAFVWLRDHGWAPPDRRQLEKTKAESARAGSYVASYRYEDEDGNLLYEVVRQEPKSFYQRRPDGSGGYVFNLDGVRRVPYRLPELLKGIRANQTVVVTEGEKDCNRVTAFDLCATTNAGGTGFLWTNDFIQPFEAARAIRVVCHSDEPGRKAAFQRAGILAKICDDVKLVDLFPDRNNGSDLSNFFDEGNSLEQFKELCRRAQRVEPTPEQDEGTEPHLTCIPASQVVVKRIEWFMRDRIPRYELTIFDGDGGIGKTSVVLDLIAKATAGKSLPDSSLLGEHPQVLILAEEDSLSMLKARLVVAGADLSCISFVTYAQCGAANSTFLLPDHVPLLQALVKKTGATLVYIDALFSHFSPELNAHHAQDVRIALRPLVEVAHSGADVWATRHWTKTSGSASSRGLGSVDVRNISRSVLSFAKHPTQFEDKGLYVMAVSKANYGPQTVALLYKIVPEATHDDSGKPWEVGRISWEGTDGTTADDISYEADPPAERSERADARELILESLATGDKSAEELDKVQRSTSGLSARTWQRARGELRKQGRIKRHGGGVAGPVYWSLIATSSTNRHISYSGEDGEECDSLAKSGPEPHQQHFGDDEQHAAYDVSEDGVTRF